MEPGQLRHRIQIREPSDANVDGQVTTTFSTAATVWGAIEYLGGRELYEAHQVAARADVQITLRFYSGLTTRHQLRQVHTDGSVVVDRTFEIVHIDRRDVRNHELRCLCIEAGD